MEKAKKWLKEETSQVSSETGILTIMGLVLGGGIAALVAPKMKDSFDNVMEKMTNASSGPGAVHDPLGTGQGDWAN
ncbi:hypothetical protein M3589_23685 [Heyndrickxia oleronia]|uniref:hypothetical protein n=1 Tax=Heyndrickxia oleronia TaxID=38875 RepID=UPI002040947D|nr:hypothetical protein [Heyndrickxia oleronia]MCM3240660.1 hypothetical protein [Heyndrickxia oleronia]